MHRLGRVAPLCLALLAAPARAEELEVLFEDLDAQRRGYTVLRVRGAPRERGRALGRAFARELTEALPQLRSLEGYAWSVDLASKAAWPAEVAEELSGMVEGIQAGAPGSPVALSDLQALNAIDWTFGRACRSHSCWGRFVAGPVRTLSTRRLDLETPFELALHHVVVLFEPETGTRWLNVAWPGFVTAVTALDARGTLVSLHDYSGSRDASPGVTFRGIAAREALTAPVAAGAGQRREQAAALLAGLRLATTTFINYYAPDGEGGVFTCAAGAGCGPPRRPQPDYLFGEALVTTNSQTDGRAMPSGAELIDAYYRKGGTKRLEDHFGLMGSTGLHLVSMEYRGESDLTVWVHGRGREDLLELEWTPDELSVNAAAPRGCGCGGAGGLGADRALVAATIAAALLLPLRRRRSLCERPSSARQPELRTPGHVPPPGPARSSREPR